METKLRKKTGKTILSKKIVRVFLSKVMDWNKDKKIISGHILLEGGTFIEIRGGKFYIVVDGERKGVILNTSLNYRRIKHVIANSFKTYRQMNANVKEGITTYRTAAINGQHNCNLFRLSGISFKENKSNFLRVAS